MGGHCRILTGEAEAAAAAAAGRRKQTPKGHIVVYVGEEMRRHVVPIPFLQNTAFRQLLEQSADAYGFHGQGGRIQLPCNEHTFLRIIGCCINPN